MREQKGKFIIIEGIDGSGKATQTDILFDRLKEEGKRVKKIDFPRYYDNFFGKLIGECLAGKHGDFLNMDPHITSVLYAADRFESMGEINKWLKRGYIVLSDRYLSSSFIHQGGKIKNKAKRLEYLRWLEKMEYQIFKIPRPDMIIYLDVPVDISQKLSKNKTLKKRYLGNKKDVHESDKDHLKNAKRSADDLIGLGGMKKISCVRADKLLDKKIISDMVYGVVGQELRK